MNIFMVFLAILASSFKKTPWQLGTHECPLPWSNMNLCERLSSARLADAPAGGTSW